MEVREKIASYQLARAVEVLTRGLSARAAPAILCAMHEQHGPSAHTPVPAHADAPFRSRLRWSSARPEALVVCCSDGRYHAQIQDFIEHQVDERSDVFATPGGPVVCDPWTSSFDEARVFDASLRFFAEAHDLSSVWLIAHEGCAYYGKKYPGTAPAELRKIQERDLHNAMKAIALQHPRYAVHSVFAALAEDVVVFHVLASSREGER